MKYIDVTIRESVYLRRGMTESKAIAYLKRYCELMPFPEVRDIEICFLDNIKHGTLLYNEEFINEAATVVDGRFGLVAVLHPDLVELKKWNPETIRKFRTVRFMISKEIDSHTEEIIDYLHALGVEVSLNVIYITRQQEDFVLRCLEVAANKRVERFCFADSCGGCTPNEVQKWIGLVKKQNRNIALNFHFHNHLNLAIANALTCYDNVDILDASVYGLGKGGGNLNLGDIIFSSRKTRNMPVTNAEIVNYAKLLIYLMNDILEENWTNALESYKNALIAFFDCNLKEIEAMETQSGNDYISFFELISSKKV